MAKEKVIIECYNPYESRFPDRKVISRGQLHIIKVLRVNGIEYEVLPNDNRKLNFLAQKELTSLLNDPVILTLYNISLGIISGLLTNLIMKSFQEDKDKIIFRNADGSYLSYVGKNIQSSDVLKIIERLQNNKNEFGKSFSTLSPFPDLPHPVNLEHTPKIIGWGLVGRDDNGMIMKELRITCKHTWERIQKAEIKGFSIGGLVSESKCQICNSDYTECNHITGQFYDGKECIAELNKLDLAEVSVVKEPCNPLANIKLVNET